MAAVSRGARASAASMVNTAKSLSAIPITARDTTTSLNPATVANQQLQTETILYLATLGGADVCCLQDCIGSFEVGKAFDALHVSLDDTCGNPAVWGTGVDGKEKERTPKNLRTWLERFLQGLIGTSEEFGRKGCWSGVQTTMYMRAWTVTRMRAEFCVLHEVLCQAVLCKCASEFWELLGWYLGTTLGGEPFDA
ncbi:hypothetical protein L210DRAFT_3655530 [Boletus edulis BED1]|uniref:Uncharacterized protein n=1 Tax=Boletus edulis BED1 TaxID=1328754 RepID=A0AAD4BCP8_BOLED|nr:hypothetical protein L210DRAFT_3655530 [Boletus edulis BED1]